MPRFILPHKGIINTLDWKLYRVTHVIGKNLPLTKFRQLWKLVGHYCKCTAKAGWRNIQNPSQRKVFTKQICYPAFLWQNNSFIKIIVQSKKFAACLRKSVTMIGFERSNSKALLHKMYLVLWGDIIAGEHGDINNRCEENNLFAEADSILDCGQAEYGMWGRSAQGD